MLDRLFDFIWDIIDLFFFAEIVDEYQGGVVLRFGKFHREIGPGLRFYWPFRIERVMLSNVVTDAALLNDQTFTLQDGTTVTVAPTITYKVHNVKRFLLEVENARGSLNDATGGVIRKVMIPHKWAELVDPVTCAAIEEAASSAVRKEAFRWGIEVIRVQFPDIVRQDGVYRVYGQPFAISQG